MNESGTVQLEYRWFEPAGGAANSGIAVLAPPHPLYGGSIDNPVVQALGTTLAELGLRALAFNWRGVGDSDGRGSGELSDAATDYRTAIDTALAGTEGPLVLAAYSFGAATALRVAAGDERIAALLLIAPPPALLGPEGLDCGRPVTVIVGSDDEFAPTAELEALAADPANAELFVIDGADHFFSTGLDEIPQRLRFSSALSSISSGI